MEVLTEGVDHVGLTVADLKRTIAFFTECLGWRLIGEKPDYPAAFVTDGTTRITLWQVGDTGSFTTFDRRANVGLHHLALKVPSLEALHALHRRVSDWDGVVVEFEPELNGSGPKMHTMIREPGGCRLEFVWTPGV